MPSTSSSSLSSPYSRWRISITQTPRIADGTDPTAIQNAMPQVDRLQLEVLKAADGLGDRRIEDVGPDRGHGRDVEDQDEEGRHQGRAAHAGHADEYANA